MILLISTTRPPRFEQYCTGRVPRAALRKTRVALGLSRARQAKPAILCRPLELGNSGMPEGVGWPISMNATSRFSVRCHASRSGSLAWAWTLAVCLLLANMAGAWHGVAHAMPRGAGVAESAVAGLAGPLTSVAQPNLTGSESSWIDALFAHHMKGQGHADCLSFDHLAQSHGLPVAQPQLSLLARAESWSMPKPVRQAPVRTLRPFNARAPPVLA